MSQETAPFKALGGVRPSLEHDVPANRIGCCVDSSGGSSSGFISVDPNLAKIMPEALFEEGAGTRIKRLARRSQHLMHDGRGERLSGRARRIPQSRPFRLAVVALPAADRMLATATSSLELM